MPLAVSGIFPTPAACTEGDIRLNATDSRARDLAPLTGVAAGRVEVCLHNQWGTVCSNGFGVAEANVTCRQLGYSTRGIRNNLTQLNVLALVPETILSPLLKTTASVHARFLCVRVRARVIMLAASTLARPCITCLRVYGCLNGGVPCARTNSSSLKCLPTQRFLESESWSCKALNF